MSRWPRTRPAGTEGKWGLRPSTAPALPSRSHLWALRLVSAPGCPDRFFHFSSSRPCDNGSIDGNINARILSNSSLESNSATSMSAPTGIAVSPELTSAFSNAVDSRNLRFLKISIQNGLC